MSVEPQSQDFEEMERRQRRQTNHEAAVNSAATSDGISELLEDVNLIEELGEPQIEDAEWRDRFPWEITRHNAFANISEEEYKELRYIYQAYARLARCELPDPGGVGSNCTGTARKTMLADPNAEDRSELDDITDRKITGFYDDLTRRTSLGKNGMLIQKLLETHVVTRDESPSSDDDSGGRLSRLAGVLRR